MKAFRLPQDQPEDATDMCGEHQFQLAQKWPKHVYVFYIKRYYKNNVFTLRWYQDYDKQTENLM